MNPADILNFHRKQAGLGIAEFAHRINVTHAEGINILCGTTPSEDALEKLAVAFEPSLFFWKLV